MRTMQTTKTFLKTAIWLIAFSMLFVITSCDKIEQGTFLEDTEGKCGQDLPNFPIRKVLIEDYTGHYCGNCPKAAETAESLKEIYCDHIVTIATHVGFFAATQSNPDNSYAYDFTTAMGDELDTQFGISAQGLPRGMVNRTEVDNKLVLAYAAWGAGVEALVGLAPDIDIDIENSYNAATRTVTTEVKSEFLTNLAGTFNVVVVITEDSIVNWQNIYPFNPVPGYPTGDVENYVHRHVLRSSFNSTWGEEIAKGDVVANTTTTKTYTMVLPEEWVEDRCSVVAYVYETSSNEVVQAEDSKVK